MAEAAARAPLSHRRVLRIALPVVLSNATIPLLGVVDTAVVGQLGDPAPIGAVGLGAVILTSIYWAFGFLRMGTVRPCRPGDRRGRPGRGGGASDPRAADRRRGGGGADAPADADLRACPLALARQCRGRKPRARLTCRCASSRRLPPSRSTASWAGSSRRSARPPFSFCNCGKNGLNAALSIWFVLAPRHGGRGRGACHLPRRMVGA